MPTVWPPKLQIIADVPSMFNNDAADQNFVVGRVTKTGLINQVEFIPSWSTTGQNTNSRTFTLINGGSTGAATTSVATLAMTSGVSLSKGVAVTMALGSAALRGIAVGDVLRWESLHVGNGMQDPGGLVIVQQTFTP